MGCHSLHQGIFLTPRSNLGLPHCRLILYHLNHQGNPCLLPGKNQIPLESITSMNCKTFLYQDWVSEAQWGQKGGWEGLLGSGQSPLKQHTLDQSYHKNTTKWIEEKPRLCSVTPTTNLGDRHPYLISIYSWTLIYSVTP